MIDLAADQMYSLMHHSSRIWHVMYLERDENEDVYYQHSFCGRTVRPGVMADAAFRGSNDPIELYGPNRQDGIDPTLRYCERCWQRYERMLTRQVRRETKAMEEVMG